MKTQQVTQLWETEADIETKYERWLFEQMNEGELLPPSTDYYIMQECVI